MVEVDVGGNCIVSDVELTTVGLLVAVEDTSGVRVAVGVDVESGASVGVGIISGVLVTLGNEVEVDVAVKSGNGVSADKSAGENDSLTVLFLVRKTYNPPINRIAIAPHKQTRPPTFQ